MNREWDQRILMLRTTICLCLTETNKVYMHVGPSWDGHLFRARPWENHLIRLSQKNCIPNYVDNLNSLIHLYKITIFTKKKVYRILVYYFSFFTDWAKRPFLFFQPKIIPGKLKISISPIENSKASLCLSKICILSLASFLRKVMNLGAFIIGGSLIGSTKTETWAASTPFLFIVYKQIISFP